MIQKIDCSKYKVKHIQFDLFIFQTEEDYSDVMNDPDFLQSVLENLPGVDPQSEAIQNAMSSLTQKDGAKKEEKKDKDAKW